MHRIILILTLMILSNTMIAQDKGSSLFDKLLFINKNDTLPYRLLKPVSPGSKDVYPLVIFLHGAGERGNDNEVQIKHITELFLDKTNRGKYPCYLVAPQCPKRESWADFQYVDNAMKQNENPSRPTRSLILLIEQIIKEFPIDQSRIYITGVSMGGFGTWDLIARFPYKFAAAVPICGGGDFSTAPKIKHIPIWVFHGAKDTTVAPQKSRAMIRALWEIGGTPGYTEFPDIAHNSWVFAYKEPHLIHWLFAQKLPEQKPGK